MLFKFCYYVCRCNAKFLWKRISNEEKTSVPLLGQIWEVGQKLWLKEHNAVFRLIRTTKWPPSIEPYMNCLEENYRQKSLQLIGNKISKFLIYTLIESNHMLLFFVFRKSLSVYHFNHIHWLGWLCRSPGRSWTIACKITARAGLDVWFYRTVNHT